MIYDDIVCFLTESTKHFDSSHDKNHAIAVYETSVKIMDSFNIDYDKEILMLASLLHDVCDHKYPNSISVGELETFIRKCVGERCGIVLKLINNISFSKQVQKKRELFEYPMNLYLDAISDADRLEALGVKGLERCITFTKVLMGIDVNSPVTNDTIIQKVVAHCDEKLLKLYPEYYITTDYGRELAKQGHQDIVNYVNLHRISHHLL